MLARSLLVSRATAGIYSGGGVVGVIVALPEAVKYVAPDPGESVSNDKHLGATKQYPGARPTALAAAVDLL